ncbi:hypothetical protein ED733_004073 [Metarhizium rileyi]|uniref:Endonuclease/exonuclease/phosphatase domain-containing protein n=1 Tax=Metarhizium rileyi (strain RCEF 4871) TaxID=1649241 RepID=A0A5C6GDH9_METRR|nr:hypothetical protein ED733_004073 [Metarhizium rileyi]
MIRFLRPAVLGLALQASHVYSAEVPDRQSSVGNGSLSVSSTHPLELSYTTSEPNPRNWIGLYYAAGGGPDNDQFNQSSSLRWSYATEAQGSVQFDNDGLGSGQYKAYFLADDGQYRSLAEPAQLIIGDPTRYPGSVSVDYSKALFNIKYTTASPDDKNWIGLYYVNSGGPVDQVEDQDQPSLTWNWARGSVGEATLSSEELKPGKYKVFLLAKGGYTWLSEPVVARFPGRSSLSFMVKEFTTKNVRQGDEFNASLANLISQPGIGDTKFRIVGGGGWASISPCGVISGSPWFNSSSSSSSSSDTTLQVEAEDKAGNTASVTVHIPVPSSRRPLVETLRLLTFNLWHGGTRVKDYHEKQVRFLLDKKVDIVGLQESAGNHGTRLAHALSWHSWQGRDVSILSRYPIAQVYSATSVSGSVRISLDGPNNENDMIVWNAHLGDKPYGPYDFCFDKMSPGRVLEREAKSGRTRQIQEMIQKMTDHVSNADKVPVFLLGDFNAPSHLDWTNASRSQHCDIGQVDWPTSKYPTDAGLVDSFRVAHPDPVAMPGITWSPIYLNKSGRPEPLDRVDFIYHKGRKLRVQNSETIVVGNPTAEPNHGDNEWTSDHRAVLTTFRVSV